MTALFTRTASRGLFDGMAIGLSGLCLVHCLALPVLIVFIPSISLVSQGLEEVHLFSAILAGIASMAAILPHWSALSTQRRCRIGGCALFGLSCLFGAMLVQDEVKEIIITLIGSVFLIAAHLQNVRRYSKPGC